MSLYVIRHAHAVDESEDPARPLSKKGRKQVKALASFLEDAEALHAREIWHSPLARSIETAERLARALKLDVKLVKVDGLEGDDDPSLIAKRLNARKQPLALVGHEPHLSALLSLLVTGEASPPRFLLKKCAAVALEQNDGVWAVRWQVSPEILP